jgi:hypothetical protein
MRQLRQRQRQGGEGWDGGRDTAWFVKKGLQGGTRMEVSGVRLVYVFAVVMGLASHIESW